MRNPISGGPHACDGAGAPRETAVARTRVWLAIVLVHACSAVAGVAAAQEMTPVPLRPNHPIVGVWRLEVPGTQCHEIYTFHTDGTGFVTSAGQVARTHFAIDDQPSAGGFYRWVDQIVDDNGKPDCTGAVMEIGHVATNFIFLLTPGDAFVICRDASLDRCLGPLRRVRTDT